MKRIILILLLFFPLMVFASNVGDVNNDGKIGTMDYILIRKHILGIESLSNEEINRADVNSDNKVNSLDYILIRKVILGIDISGNIPTPTSSSVIEVTSISLNKTSLTLDKDTSETLNVTINPSNALNKTITWTSSNTSVAAVSNGVVLAKSSGEATITAKSANGKVATCKVTVRQSNGINRIHFVKQSTAADAIILESNNHFAMIDTGYPSSSDNKRVYNYLKSLGATKLDFLILTHVHKDHTGGTEYLANNMQIDKIYMKEYVGKDHEPAENKAVYKALKKVISSKNIPVIYVDKTMKDGDGFDFQDMNLKLYNTPQRMNQSEFVGENENINSIITLVTVNNKKALLTGDSEDVPIMTKIINKVAPVNILKIPHHNFVGCSFLMETARKLNPKYLVITNHEMGTCDIKYFSYGPTSYYVNNTSNKAIVFTIGSSIKVTK